MRAGLLALPPTALAALRCPHCAGRLAADPTGLTCPRRHRFDRARAGTVDLSGGRITHDGDTREMVEARSHLLESGALSTVTEALTDTVPPSATGLVLDAGAGTGHHLARVLDARSGLVGLAVDVSKAALRRAARAHDRMAAVRGDVWRGLPVADACVDVLFNVFAPRSAAEFRRVIRADGLLVVVTPGADHLRELVVALGLIGVDPQKRTRLTRTLAPWFVPEGQVRRQTIVRLSRADAAAMVLMGPSAWHLDTPELGARIADLDEPVATTISIHVDTWRPARTAPVSRFDDVAADDVASDG